MKIKIITVKSCEICPYVSIEGGACECFCTILHNKMVAADDIDPDCPLNDISTLNNERCDYLENGLKKILNENDSGSILDETAADLQQLLQGTFK